ncbi:MAG: MBL fold metallo-hydrolase [Desulfamplus sp.]|nr:MBL fold metallo-hydrolase [Desulfamplus sp.]
MRLCKTYQFNSGITGLKLGWSLAGPPLMTVYCYLFGDTMIDTGQSHIGREVVSIACDNRIKQIFLTHHHEDHSGNAAAIQILAGANVFGHHLSIEKLKIPYSILPYQKYVWGKTTPLTLKPLPEQIETVLGKMISIHTPGHSKDHTVFFLPDQGIIFSGDLYLGDRIKFFRADEDIGTQIESLKKLVDLDFDILLCGHNPKQKKGKEHICLKLNFLENLYGDIIELWKKGLPEKEVFRSLKLKESHFIKYFCFGNVSMINGVSSSIRHHKSINRV